MLSQFFKTYFRLDKFEGTLLSGHHSGCWYQEVFQCHQLGCPPDFQEQVQARPVGAVVAWEVLFKYEYNLHYPKRNLGLVITGVFIPA
jgi:hypothetical protein